MSRPAAIRRRLRGAVVGDTCAKTITVEVTRRFRHPKYGKMVRRDIRVHAHDEGDAAHIGDTVEIEECRPLSRTKRWRLVQVLERNPEQAVPSVAPPQAEGTPAT
jgi:small subunit ribosomal protein S17